MKSTYLADQAAGTKATEYMFPPEMRLFDDPYSVQFCSRSVRFYINILKSKLVFRWMIRLIEKTAPGVYGGLVCRNRYIDDAIKEAIKADFEVVVNLGGGYDTRSLRIEEMSDITYYHIDLPEVVESFKNKMEELPSGIPNSVRFVPIDFNRQDLEHELERAGYDKMKKTLFIWEGVTQYINEEALISTFKYIASTKTGNRVTFTYVLKALLDNPEEFPIYSKVVKQIEKRGVKWINGLDPDELRDYLKDYGLNLIEDVGEAEYRQRYLLPIGRDMAVMPIERIVLAEVRD